MTEPLDAALRAAWDRLASSDHLDPDAWADVHRAERRLAEARGEPWAEPLDLGVRWDGGAPLPHVVANGSTTVLVCHASEPDPYRDGTSVTVVSPSDPEPSALLEFTFEGCHAAMLGGPNDEALNGHPLHGRGLEAYRPHVVHRSPWIAEQERINSAHPGHRGGWADRLTHYFFVFHDEMFEAIARSVRVEQVHGTLHDRLVRAVTGFTR